MNRYGTRAMRHRQAHRPAEYAQISDPATFFARMGETMAAQINSLSLSLAGDDPPGEAYLDKVGRLNMARMQAEDQVLRETLPPAEEDETEPDTDR